VQQRQGRLVVFSGPSGVGKTTITTKVRQRVPQAVFSVSATTRKPAPTERDGVAYYFLSEEEFADKVAAGAFLEHATFAGARYGTLRSEVEARLSAGAVVILDIDVQGAEQVKRVMPEAQAIFILPPDEQTLLRRLRERGRDSEEAIQRRHREAQREIAFARSSNVYDELVVNDDLDRAVDACVKLIERKRTPSDDF